MMATEFQLDPRDQEKYGGPTWVVFDRDALDDLPFADLYRFEKQLGVSLPVLLGSEFAKATALGITGVVWVARQMAGVDTPFAEFNIRTRRVRHRPAGGDADPPAAGSSGPSPENAA